MASKNDKPEKPKRENPFKRIASVYTTIKAIDQSTFFEDGSTYRKVAQ